ncbi:MAG: hypothetical protein IPG03_00070 [Candidatus Microthrix sp.]|nr:hypothetical protein [Candidatus Microthrix sp.]MBK6500808.1 hypothetical protein [Candidatus Microthrix sp.]
MTTSFPLVANSGHDLGDTGVPRHQALADGQPQRTSHQNFGAAEHHEAVVGLGRTERSVRDQPAVVGQRQLTGGQQARPNLSMGPLDQFVNQRRRHPGLARLGGQETGGAVDVAMAHEILR